MSFISHLRFFINKKSVIVMIYTWHTCSLTRFHHIAVICESVPVPLERKIYKKKDMKREKIIFISHDWHSSSSLIFAGMSFKFPFFGQVAVLTTLFKICSPLVVYCCFGWMSGDRMWMCEDTSWRQSNNWLQYIFAFKTFEIVLFP